MNDVENKRNYVKEGIFIIFLFLMMGILNSLQGQDVFKASTLLDKGTIYMSSYQGQLSQGQLASAEFSLQANRVYQILKLSYIKGELVAEESLIIKTTEAEMLRVALKNETDVKKLKYLIILGYGGRIIDLN